MDAVRIRAMRESDIGAGVALCRAAHWNQTAREWELFLAIAPDNTAVAETKGQVVGTALTVPYSPRLGWVAMVLVDPACRGRGIGRRLLLHAIDSAPPGVALGLDATPAGRLLYVTLGFADGWGLARWHMSARDRAALATGRVAPSLENRTIDVQPIARSDLPAITALDRSAFGADRRAVLEWCWQGAPEYAWATRSERSAGAIDGFVLGRHGHDTEHIGPVVAPTLDAAAALVGAVLACARRPAISIDVPDRQEAFRTWLQDRGFTRERAFTRMFRGAAAHTGVAGLLFATAGPELG